MSTDDNAAALSICNALPFLYTKVKRSRLSLISKVYFLLSPGLLMGSLRWMISKSIRDILPSLISTIRDASMTRSSTLPWPFAFAKNFWKRLTAQSMYAVAEVSVRAIAPVYLQKNVFVLSFVYKRAMRSFLSRYAFWYLDFLRKMFIMKYRKEFYRVTVRSLLYSHWSNRRALTGTAVTSFLPVYTGW